jgi:hypothetical protein
MAASRLADARYGDGYVASDHAVRLRWRLLHADKKQQPRMFTFLPAAAAALCMPQSWHVHNTLLCLAFSHRGVASRAQDRGTVTTNKPPAYCSWVRAVPAGTVVHFRLLIV